MSQQTPEPVAFTVTEKTDATHVRWTVRVGRTVITDIRQQLTGSMCDSAELTRAIAQHYEVGEDAVTYQAGRSRGARLVPRRGRVTLPPPAAEPQWCDHRPGEPACELPTCGGTPPVTTPLDRDCIPIPEQPGGGYESGDVTAGRDLMQAIARATGMQVTGGSVANNGWSDTRWGARHIHGLLFTVDTADVRVLSYEGRASAVASHLTWHAAVYVDQTCVAPALNTERAYPSWKSEAVRVIAETVEARHDAQAVAEPTKNGYWLLKNPPVGFNVDTGAHGLVEVAEPSRNGGMTLYVLDAEGRTFFTDRKVDEFWPATYGGAAIDGHDTPARFQRRKEFFDLAIGHRHQVYGHEGPATACDRCPAGVAGEQVMSTGHYWGRYVTLPWCTMCGLPAGKRATATGRCPGSPRHPDPADEGAAAEKTAFVVPPEVREQATPVARVHVRSSSPTLVDYDNGRQGMANACWCGRITLPEGDKAWHVYGLTAERVTCPVCFHLFTCPWARVDSRVEYCPACMHIYLCDDEQCIKADHPGIVGEPDPHFDREARTGAVLDRIHRAVKDGDLDAADKLIDAGEDYEPGHDIPGHEGWEGLRMHVWRLRKQAQHATDQPSDVDETNTGRGAAALPEGVEGSQDDTPAASPHPSPAPTTADAADAQESPADGEAGALWASVLEMPGS